MTLRYYQRDAVDACYRFLSEHPGRNPCIVLPTGAGKTHVIVQLCQDMQAWGGRVLVLAHVKELLGQAHEKLVGAGLRGVGLHSAGLKSRDMDSSVLVAGVQSVFRKGAELCGSVPFNMVVVDEAHRIPLDGDGMYRQLLDDLTLCNPKLRVVGLTATPYRTGTGYVCSDDHFLHEVCYEADIKELIAGGFLCRLASKRSRSEVDMTGVSVRSGDYVGTEMEQRFNQADHVAAAVNEMMALTQKRKKVLVFCCGIDHAANVAYMLEAAGESVRLVTSQHEGRDKAIKAFKEGRCKYLCNVNVLTEGFDATDIDAVVLLRATVSPGLYYQMVGRGLRIDPRKQDCLVLDYGGNIARHGTIDNLVIKPKGGGNKDGEAPVKSCPECQEMIHASLLYCSNCGFQFEDREPNHEETAADQAVVGRPHESFDVCTVGYSLHIKKDNPDAPKSMRVTYYQGDHMGAIADEWVCVEHTGFAFEKASQWWRRRCNGKMPTSAEQAVSYANRGGLTEPTKIVVERIPGKPFKKIIAYELAPPVNSGDVASEEELIAGVFEDEEIPW